MRIGVVICVLIALLGAAFWMFANGARFDTARLVRMFGSDESRAETLDRDLIANKDSGPVFQKMKAAFPEEYAQFLKSTVTRTEDSREARLARLEKQVTGVLSAHATEALRADDATLAVLTRQQAAAYDVLAAENPRLCGSLGYGADVALMRVASPRARAALVKVTETLIDAIVAGRSADHPERKALTDSEAQVLAESMQNEGVTAAEFKTIETRGRDALSAQRRCAVTTALYRAAVKQNEAFQARFAVLMLRGA